MWSRGFISFLLKYGSSDFFYREKNLQVGQVYKRFGWKKSRLINFETVWVFGTELQLGKGDERLANLAFNYLSCIIMLDLLDEVKFLIANCNIVKKT